MSASGIKLGVALGMVTAVASFYPIFMLATGQCFFEQGCDPHEGLKILGVFLASCVAGVVVALAAAKVHAMVAGREPRK
jgi:predicted outer membrane lipoprotein